MKICPTPKLYLSVTEDIPKYLEDAKYLSKNVFEKVILTSYPRSGNTLLRKYLEDITGVRFDNLFQPKFDEKTNLIFIGCNWQRLRCQKETQ
jgi:predicted ATP-grasp superfamily ATP-dependent carboligase